MAELKAGDGGFLSGISRQLMVHELKTWPDFFNAILSGDKTFELRRDDRGFQVGDTLHLREYVKAQDRYTGRELRVAVTYLLGGQWPGLSMGYVAMAIQKLDKLDNQPHPSVVRSWNDEHTALTAEIRSKNAKILQLERALKARKKPKQVGAHSVSRRRKEKR